jgi:hypothetical protein
MANLTETQIQLMNLLSNKLFGNQLKIGDKVDWNALLVEAQLQAVLPLAYLAADQLIPIEYRKIWKTKVYNQISKNINISYEHAQLNDLMYENNIPYVILKGVASSIYYPDPILRCFGDVDFLVHDEDMERVCDILEGIGMVNKNRTKCHHEKYCRLSPEGIVTSTWEVHRSINGVPSSDIGSIVDSYMEDIFETAVDYDEGNGMVRIPDEFHHGLILLLHTASHIIKEGIGLRQLCDWLMFVNHFTDNEFKEIFEDKLKTVGLWKFAQLLTLCGTRYLGCPPKEWSEVESKDVIDSLICDIINGGNFGIKDEDRDQQRKLIHDNGSKTINKNGFIKQTVIYLHKKNILEFPNASKYRLLLPIEYVYTTSKVLVEVISGKHKSISKNIVQKALWRREIYNEFNLFKAEKVM